MCGSMCACSSLRACMYPKLYVQIIYGSPRAKHNVDKPRQRKGLSPLFETRTCLIYSKSYARQIRSPLNLNSEPTRRHTSACYFVQFAQ